MFAECKEKIGRINGGEVCSLYEYDAEREDELSFHCGEQLRIVRRGDVNEREWWWAENRRKQAGYVPYNLLGVGIKLVIVEMKHCLFCSSAIVYT